MKALLKLLGLDEARADDARDTATVRRIAAQIDALPPEEARFLGAFAYVLARIARADLEVSPEESEAMARLVREASALGEAQAVLVVQIAKTQVATLGGTENYLVTRQFRELSSREQRIELLRCLFAVAAADASISHLENTEITAIGLELGFSREEIASVRAGWRQHLSVLKAAKG